MNVSILVLLLVVELLLIALVGLVAAAETAFIRVGRTRADAIAAAEADDHVDGDRAPDPRVDRLRRQVRRPLTTLASLALAGLAAELGALVIAWQIGGAFGGNAGSIVAAVAVSAAIFVALMQGRGRAVLAPDATAVRLMPVVRVAAPLAIVAMPLVRMIRRTGHSADPDPDVDEQQLLAIVEETAAIDGAEEELIRRVVAFDDQTVGSIMTPRTDMVTIASGLPVTEAIGVAERNGLSRIPVTAAPGDVDDIIGAVHVKDLWSALLDKKHATDVDLWLRDVTVVPELQRAARLLHELKTSAMHLAVVIDEHGGVAGVVTLEDILEELVGEIEDEFDSPEPELVVLDQRTIRVDGRCEIPRIEAALGLDLPSGSRTIAGCVFNGLGRVPEVADVLYVEESMLELEVLHMQGRRIAEVEVRLAAPLPTAIAPATSP